MPVGNASPKGEQIQKSRSQRLQEKSNGCNRMDAYFASLRPVGGKAEARQIVLRVVEYNPDSLRTYETRLSYYATEQILRWLRMTVKGGRFFCKVSSSESNPLPLEYNKQGIISPYNVILSCRLPVQAASEESVLKQ